MNREQLLDAIGSADESLLKETEQLRMAAMDKPLTAVQKSHKTTRRMTFLLAACMVLVLGTVAAYATGLIGRRAGTVTTSNDDEGNAVMVFTPDEDMRVPLSMIKGEVKNATQEMRSQWTKNPETGEYEWNGSDQGFRADVPGVGIFQKSFNTLADATAYIGYDGMVTPVFNETVSPQFLFVTATGIADNLEDPGTDPEYHLDFISIMSYYTVDGLNVSFNTYLVTEAFESPRAIQRQEVSQENGEVQLTTETVVVNNREFQIVHQDLGGPETTEDGYPIAKRYFDTYIWAENKVEYRMEINYTEFDKTRADRIIADWMNSFTD